MIIATLSSVRCDLYFPNSMQRLQYCTNYSLSILCVAGWYRSTSGCLKVFLKARFGRDKIFDPPFEPWSPLFRQSASLLIIPSSSRSSLFNHHSALHDLCNDIYDLPTSTGYIQVPVTSCKPASWLCNRKRTSEEDLWPWPKWPSQMQSQ